MISENESAIGSSPALLMKCNGRRQTNATHSRFTMMRLLALLLAMIIPSLTQAAMGPEELKALGLNDPCAAVDVRTRQGLPVFNLPYPLPARVLPAPNDKLVRILPVKPEPAGNPQAAPYGSPVWEYQQFVEWREKEKWVMARLQHEMHVNQHEEETHRLVLECAKRNPCLGSELFARRGPTTLKITMPTERELPRTLLNSHGVVDGNRPANAIRTIQWEWNKYHQGTLIYQQGFTPTLAQMKKNVRGLAFCGRNASRRASAPTAIRSTAGVGRSLRGTAKGGEETQIQPFAAEEIIQVRKRAPGACAGYAAVANCDATCTCHSDTWRSAYIGTDRNSTDAGGTTDPRTWADTADKGTARTEHSSHRPVPRSIPKAARRYLAVSP